MTNSELLEQVAGDLRQLRTALLGDKELELEGRLPVVEKRVGRLEKGAIYAVLVIGLMLMGAKAKDVVQLVASVGVYIQALWTH